MKTNFLLLDDLRSGHRSLSISSNLSSSIRCCWISIRTELVQKWSLMVRIRTSMKRISKSKISLSKLLFRPDSGQIELDIGAQKTQKQQHKTREQLELIQQRTQSGTKLIFKITKLNEIKKFNYLKNIRFYFSKIFL